MNRLWFYPRRTVYNLSRLRPYLQTVPAHFSYYWGFLYPLLYIVFDLLRHITLLQIIIDIGDLESRYKRGYPLNPCSSFLYSRLFVDIYVFFWLLIIELAFFLFFVTHPSHILPILPICIFLSWRLLDIFINWVNVLILPARPASPQRLLILVLTNFLETVIIFTVITFLSRNAFRPEFVNIQNSLHYTISVLVPIIPINTDIQRISWVGSAIFYSEIAFVFLFLIVIINRTLAFFRT